MSDLFEAREKTEKGAEWRGSINVDINDETHELTVRQLRDPEQWEVMAQIDLDELEALQGELPEEEMEELQELQEADRLSDDEEDRLEELQAEIEDEDIDLFDTLSYETYEGLKKTAKYGVEPDDADIRNALAESVEEIREMYGGSSNDDARQYLQDQMIAPMIEESTDFTSFAIGVKVLGETLGDTKN
jgi:hypothetical protein